MQRQQWRFEYSGNTLAQAAKTKLEHHRNRYAFYQARKHEVMETIRADGLAIEEKMGLQRGGTRAPVDFEGGAKIMIRVDLQNQLDECLKKLAHHTQKITEYEGWSQVLEANPNTSLALDHDDWLYFFSKR